MRIEEEIRQKKFESPQTKAWINMIYTFNCLMDRINQVFKQFGITQQQYNVLRILRGRQNEAATCAEVKSVMLDKNPDLTRLCDRLVLKDLIKREINQGNRREMELRITGKGLELLETIRPELEKHNRFLENLSASEAMELSRLLDKLRA